MRYAFVLGREPALSIAEILACLKAEGVAFDPKEAVFSPAILIIDADRPLDIGFFRSLGGSIKMAEVVKETASIDKDLTELLSASKEGAIDFGVSLYDAGRGTLRMSNLNLWMRVLPLELKKKLKAEGRPARVVVPKNGVALSSVQVDKNKLLEKGTEALILAGKEKTYLAKTIAVQEFEEFSARDFGRPGRDAHSGMLPPKLARIMINLSMAPKDGTLLDPFCGSGTVLSEGALLGYGDLIGSDISEKAVTDTQTNLKWTLEHQPERKPKSRIFQCDVKHIDEKLGAASVSAIVSEPFLGPPLRGEESDQKIHFIYLELMGLYRKAFEALAKTLKPGAPVVFVFPVFKDKHINLHRELEQLGFRAEGLLPGKALEALGLKSATGLLYKRPDQRVGREIFRFRYKG